MAKITNEEIAERVEEIRSLPKGRALTMCCKKLIVDLKDSYTLGSAKVKLSGVRKSIGEKHPALAKLILSEADYAQLKSGWSSKVVRDQTNMRPLRAREILHVASGVLANKRSTPRQRAVALMLLTGRRPYEVLVTGCFRSDRKSKAHAPLIKFSGQAKTRQSPLANIGEFSIPVLDTPKVVLKNLRMVQSAFGLDGLDSETFHNRFGKDLHSECMMVFGGDFSPKDLRSAYAAIADSKYRTKGFTDIAYFATILGHRLLGNKELDLAAAMHYKDFELVSEER